MQERWKRRNRTRNPEYYLQNGHGTRTIFRHSPAAAEERAAVKWSARSCSRSASCRASKTGGHCGARPSQPGRRRQSGRSVCPGEHDPGPRFESRGPHLRHVVTLDIPDAVLGTKLLVPTVDSEVKVRIPPGTQPGTVIPLHGHGLPVFGSSEWGNLYVEVRVQVPERLNRKERGLYRQLRRLKHEQKQPLHDEP